MPPLPLTAKVAGRFVQEGEGEVCAVFRRSFYLRFPGERYACIGDASLGRGPLNALVDDFRLPSLGERLSVAAGQAETWTPPTPPVAGEPDVEGLQYAARARLP